uniref:Uncharacterized protein n=1 Tax=Micrurus carvalhoi TaxID=3147026 RepID=A0A2H6NJ50_9SAUR
MSTEAVLCCSRVTGRDSTPPARPREEEHGVVPCSGKLVAAGDVKRSLCLGGSLFQPCFQWKIDSRTWEVLFLAELCQILVATLEALPDQANPWRLREESHPPSYFVSPHDPRCRDGPQPFLAANICLQFFRIAKGRCN